MARDFKRVDREQQFLMPPSILDWLPKSHPVWLLIEVVKGLDLSAFEAKYVRGGVGRQAYPPSMMVTLLVWCMANGVVSSRRIERACLEDISCRVICGGLSPDHTTISTFRARHEAELAALFEQSLMLCGRAGLVELGTVALDGTKMSANASAGANRSPGWLERQVNERMQAAADQDRADDERFGEGDGFSVPEDFADPATRVERVAQLLDTETNSDGDSGGGGGAVGRGGSVERFQSLLSTVQATGAARVNLTDPESGLMHHANGGWVQGYNCQIVCTTHQVVLAVSVSSAPNDYGQFGPMVASARENLVAAGIGDAIGVVLADAGYNNPADLEFAENDPAAVLIAMRNRRDLAKAAAGPEPGRAWTEEQAQIDAEHRAEQQRRAAVYAQVDVGELSHRDGQELIGISGESFHRGYSAWKRSGVDAVPARKRRNPHTKPDQAAVRRWQMRVAFEDQANRDRYKQRGHTVETYFGNLKANTGLARFSRRGQQAVEAEWSTMAAANNIMKTIRAFTNLTGLVLRT